MHKVYFYQDKNGVQPVKKYLDTLEIRSFKTKEDRIKYNKIDQYIEILQKYGTMAGFPYVKHLNGELWELRPLNDRILFFCWDRGSFILLSHFVKKTQKTPKQEIRKAQKRMNDFKERCAKNEEKH